MNLSKLISCRHCGNIAKMEIIGNVNDDQIDYDTDEVPISTWGIHYNILRCPACEKINIVSYTWHDGIESDEEISYEFLYPQNLTYPIGLPENILTAFKAAEKVKSIDVNAYAILMRRLLELVCIDRNAMLGSLAVMLKDLATKNEIPEKLVKVAIGLKDFGNIGAHAGTGELTEKEIPIVNALCNAILEYVYSAPYLATLAENKLQTIKKTNKKKDNKSVKMGFIDNNKLMNIYINEEGNLYISIGAVGENIQNNGYITLDKDNLKELIQGLVDMEKDMEV